ncbi:MULTISPECIES: phage head-tail joining protein [Jeongeupia]|uniref:Uncharacterized protein n=2 Tax=Jeongeupia TaxID=885864 RepID=A0ABS2BF97_9NEIS|nr:MULTISPECIES: hypothetical protein [Jeongeupia]MBM3114271.1 hypothetical protein [Jeongeupia naejangsanensis]GHD60358.1 hypothetical protein GCM10007350_13270 [Jeongeupia chitinilytica]
MAEFTLDDLNELSRAIASGELTIERDNRKVTYRSMDELMTARNLVRNDLIRAGLIRDGDSRSVAASFDRY